MSIIFSPSGFLNIAADASELPETAGQTGVSSGAMVRCKNLRLNEAGKAKTRDGSIKLNENAIDTEIWWIEEQSGIRYTFAGTYIYSDETSIATGLESAQWAAIKYNAFNDLQLNIFALNGTDRKRIQNGVVREWGIDAPTEAPTLSQGGGSGLTGRYNVKYTYARKAGDVVVAESDPSPAGEEVELSGGSLGVTFGDPTDPQITHIRLYRTWADGEIYYHDQDILANVNYIYGKAFDWELFDLDTSSSIIDYDYGYGFDWESSESYIDGPSYKYTAPDSVHSTENLYRWEYAYTSEGVLTITLSASYMQGLETASLGDTVSITTDAVTASVEFDYGPVVFLWTKLSGDAITISDPNSASTMFIADGVALQEARTAFFRCTATDSVISDYADIEVYIAYGPV